MGIKKRILLFVLFFGILSAVSVLLFNQSLLKNALVNIQDKQIKTSVELGQQRVDQLFREMEQASRNLASFGAQLYKIQSGQTVDDVDQVAKNHLITVFGNLDQSIGGGIWYEPKVFKPEETWYGPYVFKEDNGRIQFTWDLSTEAYNYHKHDWYQSAFETDVLFDEQVYWSQPYVDAAGSTAFMVTVTAPILSETGAKVGVATVDWAIKHLADAVKSIEFTENAYAFLISRNIQKYLSTNDDGTYTLKAVKAQSWGEQVLRSEGTEAINKIDNLVVNDQVGSVYFRSISDSLRLGIFLPKRDYMKYVEQFAQRNLLYTGILTIVFLLGTLFILNKMFAPLSQIIDEIKGSVIADPKSSSIRVRHINDTDVPEFSPMVDMLNKVYEQINENTVQIEHKNLALQKQQNEIHQFNVHLEEKVAERTSDLELKTQELLQVLNELQETQQQMIEMEKNAALGRLVAGVAHEINTPVGICITSISHLQQMYVKVKQDFETGALKKNELEGFFRDIEEVSEMIQFNLTRTKELVSSFKQVSTDQSVEELNVVNLSEYIELILISLRPMLEEANVEVELDIDDKLIFESYPGVWYQLLNNLISNSVNHAFKDTQDHCIKVIADQDSENRIHFTYQDNGSGMTEDVKNRLFEPFFTTSRHLGGTGLGMHITYNLITQKLKGEISISSEPEQGSRFDILIPVNPQKNTAASIS